MKNTVKIDQSLHAERCSTETIGKQAKNEDHHQSRKRAQVKSYKNRHKQPKIRVQQFNMERSDSNTLYQKQQVFQKR